MRRNLHYTATMYGSLWFAWTNWRRTQFWLTYLIIWGLLNNLREAFLFRSLRKTSEVERVKIDIKDFHASGLGKLQANSWVAIGKHLCGAATDFCIRSCRGAAKQEGKLRPTRAETYKKGLQTTLNLHSESWNLRCWNIATKQKECVTYATSA